MNDLDREGYNPYFDIKGHRYYISSHAVNRAYEMKVPLPIVRHILESGKRTSNTGKYKGSYYVEAGKVALAVAPENDASSTVITVVWTTDEAWNEWFAKCGDTGGRQFRRADYLKSLGKESA